ncbi:hypothetical protein EW093_13110 [Thiospirochaeta perfilievii]|uniref:Uncharacterized protein n=1 Tax=Thiospirochaeta perfilievii TaxID=252967 RepID=A0A5C1QF16_9SPIO|nr:hypothetical protein [Thiospirochaeta perfilievii]QEN05609.1 hypothetical protein EW093_13110 [Thiospirochaeta perfilievii]
MQESGENLPPNAENLRHVLTRYNDGGDDPNKMIQLLPGAYIKASNYLQNHKDTRSNFNKVADLVEGFESSYGLELLSTVHWVINNNNLNSFQNLVDTIYEWNDRKKNHCKSN